MIAKAVQASGSYMTDTAAIGGRDAAGGFGRAADQRKRAGAG